MPPVSGNCWKCGKQRRRLHKDPVVPRDSLGNIQYLCANCHEDMAQDNKAELKPFETRGARRVRQAQVKRLVAAMDAADAASEPDPFEGRDMSAFEVEVKD